MHPSCVIFLFSLKLVPHDGLGAQVLGSTRNVSMNRGPCVPEMVCRSYLPGACVCIVHFSEIHTNLNIIYLDLPLFTQTHKLLFLYESYGRTLVTVLLYSILRKNEQIIDIFKMLLELLLLASLIYLQFIIVKHTQFLCIHGIFISTCSKFYVAFIGNIC